MNDASIGLARDFYAAQIVENAELFLEHLLERLNPGAAGIDQRTVDVEKKKPLGMGCFQS